LYCSSIPQLLLEETRIIDDFRRMSNAETNNDTDDSVVEQSRSGWSLTFTLLGWIGVIAGCACGVFYFDASRDTQSSLLTGAIAGIAGGLQALLFGFLIDVFTDIRWYLKKIANKD